MFCVRDKAFSILIYFALFCIEKNYTRSNWLNITVAIMRFLEAKNMKEMIGIRSQLDAILQSNFFRTTFLELDGVLWQFWDDNIDLG